MKTSRQITDEAMSKSENSYAYALGCLQVEYDNLLADYQLLQKRADDSFAARAASTESSRQYKKGQ